MIEGRPAHGACRDVIVYKQLDWRLIEQRREFGV
jgi:hypothetical protein